ncbi:hypothetical protein H8E52_09485 [bacterium]|nr:hypothetical protein [bacterium]
MFRFFRTIRRDLIVRNRFTNYLLYALGEIVLVVIGILIALQINNWNDLRKAHELEMKYLGNIKADLVNNIAEIDRFIEDRSGCIEDASIVIGHLEGVPIADLSDFNRRCIRNYEWRRFAQINFTFEELISSGNLALISSTRIKSSLLRLESAYTANKAEEDHYRFDSEELLYKPLYHQVDLHPMLRDFTGETGVLSWDHFEVFMTDPRFKNGFLMVILELSKLNEQLEEMKGICMDLITEIDAELDLTTQ